jgi:hypothetical protein
LRTSKSSTMREIIARSAGEIFVRAKPVL